MTLGLLRAAVAALCVASLASTADAGTVHRAVSQALGARLKTAVQVRPAVMARTGAAPCRAIPSKCAGLQRERYAEAVLKARYPSSRVQPETYLLERTGRRAIDSRTGQGRRIDFVVIGNDRAARGFEITSQTADKRAQLRKEGNIRALDRMGGPRQTPLYIRDRANGGLIPAPRQPSEVIRFR